MTSCNKKNHEHECYNCIYSELIDGDEMPCCMCAVISFNSDVCYYEPVEDDEEEED